MRASGLKFEWISWEFFYPGSAWYIRNMAQLISTRKPWPLMLSRKFSSHQVFEKKGCKKYKKNTIYIKKKKCFERETNPVQKNMNFLHSTAKFTLTNYIWKKCFLKLASNTKCSLMPPAEIEWPQSLSFIFFLLCT